MHLALLLDLLSTPKPLEGSAFELHPLSRQAVYHHHEHVRSHCREEVPPAMKLKDEAPRHAHLAFQRCELRAINVVELPEEVAEEEAPCKDSVSKARRSIGC